MLRHPLDRPRPAFVPAIVGVVACLLLVWAPASALVDFNPARRDFLSGRFTRDVAAIDFNEDGKLDLACVRFNINGPSSIVLFQGDGRGHFQRFGAEFPTAGGAATILAADFDEDGHTDLITPGFLANPATIGLHRGDGRGVFTLTEIPYPGVNPYHANGGDLNRDGHLDLVAGGTTDGKVRVLLGDGNGQFVLNGSLVGGGAPQYTAIGDIDADGMLDLAVADNQGDVLLYFGDGLGGFDGPRILPVGASPVWVDILAIGDPGRPYLAVAARAGDEVEVFQWNPDRGELERVVRLAVSRAPVSVALLSLPPGETPGLAVATENSSQLHVWPTLAGTPSVLRTQDSPTAVRIADWTGDGVADFVLPGFNTESVSLFIGVGSTAAAAPSLELGGRPSYIRAVDLNGDRRTDLAVLRVLEQRITGLVARESGVIDFVDIGAPFPRFPNGLAAIDLGDDPSPDFAVGDTFGSDLWILRSSANYDRETITLAGSGPSDIESADLDHDGVDDLAVSLFTTSNVSIHFGTRGGGFTFPVPVAVGQSPVRVAIGDLDRNGLEDLVIANNDVLTLSVLMQGPARVFTSLPQVPFRVGFPGGLAVGHLDTDDELDVVVGGLFGLELFKGDGAGGLASLRFIETAAEFNALSVADLDLDGIDELVAADRVGNAMVVLPGSVTAERAAGETVSYPPLSFGVEFLPVDFDILELDGDGRPDLAVVSSTGGTLSLLLTGGAEGVGDREDPARTDLVEGVGPRVRLAANPFRTEAALVVDVGRPGPAVLRIYDSSGRLIATPFAGRLNAGRSELIWEGRDARGALVPRGIYFYRLRLGGETMRGKLVRY